MLIAVFFSAVLVLNFLSIEHLKQHLNDFLARKANLRFTVNHALHSAFSGNHSTINDQSVDDFSSLNENNSQKADRSQPTDSPDAKTSGGASKTRKIWALSMDLWPVTGARLLCDGAEIGLDKLSYTNEFDHYVIQLTVSVH